MKITVNNLPRNHVTGYKRLSVVFKYIPVFELLETGKKAPHTRSLQATSKLQRMQTPVHDCEEQSRSCALKVKLESALVEKLWRARIHFRRTLKNTCTKYGSWFVRFTEPR